MKYKSFYLSVIVLIFCFASSVAFSQNNYPDLRGIVSRPAGFVRIEIPSNSQSLVSMPFKPFDSSINSILANQLTGSTNEETGIEY